MWELRPCLFDLGAKLHSNRNAFNWWRCGWRCARYSVTTAAKTAAHSFFLDMHDIMFRMNCFCCFQLRFGNACWRNIMCHSTLLLLRSTWSTWSTWSRQDSWCLISNSLTRVDSCYGHGGKNGFYLFVTSFPQFSHNGLVLSQLISPSLKPSRA